MDLDPVLQRYEQSDLLRFTTVGSVDDGKSTLIGRLLYESQSLYQDHISSVRKASATKGHEIDFSLFTDGLKAEREQGITIDVAYRCFATARRRFIIADVPGHEQYTRNMVTGASTAQLAVILIDAEKGILPQSKRHAFIASLLGVQHVVVAVNKMDRVGYDRAVFDRICDEVGAFAAKLGLKDIVFIPLSALIGDNVIAHSPRTPWYEGSTLLNHLETVHIAADQNLIDFRFPVQYVLRPDADFRGYAGQIAGGVVRVGDEVTVLPSGLRSRVTRIVTREGDLDYAFPPMSVALCLEHERDHPRTILKGHRQAGPGDQLFCDWRYNSDGSLKTDFVLNQPQHRSSHILLAGDNFGCGSSREHAPWALTAFGFRAVISTTIADIFRSNSLKNGLLPVILSAKEHVQLQKEILESQNAEVTIDLEKQTLTFPSGASAIFPIDPFSKFCLLNGVDELEYLRRFTKEVEQYEAAHSK